ncbi:cell migration-inducing and hyaluronan-binding protein-like [Saccostrea echinata]|uniref:cell migration-inducing and hyaluronan-binding protein-like n=1 Tax=Saccostrea echinata TaxID=191078 RepID=UPI002A82DE1E|nr:cell migration-inducing and hyaluronan-binding protein-like [Saccostrea echinata]
MAVARFSFLSCLLYISTVLSACPDQDPTLKPWSNANSWPSGQVPQENDEVIINFPVLVDTSPPQLSFIEIQNGGKLVWSRNGDHSVRLGHILIKNGAEMHIGSEDCQFDRKARITLLDEPEGTNVPSFGDKFIGVEEGGTLELHGKDKRSWTKLTKTAPKYDKTLGDIYKHRDNSPSRSPGVFVYHFSVSVPEDYDLVNDKAVLVSGSIHQRLDYWNQDKVNSAIANLTNFLNGIPDGDIFAIATQKNFLGSKDASAIYSVMDALGATAFKLATTNDAYVAIGLKGHTSTVQEVLGGDASGGADYNEASITYIVPNIEREITVTSYNHGVEEWRSYTEFHVINTYLTRPVISVYDDVMNEWNVGDKVFITSTDYRWYHVEEFTIIECSQCPPKFIRLDHSLKYEHYGEIYKRVDMRAEVGLMTRYIHITSEVSEGNTNGGHVKFLKGFKRVAVEGTELTNLGDPLILGRYPLHYHMCYDLADRTLYPQESYLRRNSIHHTQFRCMTIHGTQSAYITDNVCYNSVGHGFFLEDGGERNITFYRNLGLGQRRFKGDTVLGVTGAIPADKTKGPATFWITNPLTTLVNNVAAGGEGIGYWYIFPHIPTGPSANKNFMQPGEAKNTRITKFLDNSCHSHETCLFVDNELEDDLTFGGYNHYNPKLDPLDPSSPPAPALFDGFTASKCTVQNLWIRSSPVIVRRASLSDSRFGAFLLREDSVWQVFEDSVIIGLSDNVGENLSFRDRDITGFRFSKGPITVRNTWFGGFESSAVRTAAAVGNQECMTHNDPRNSLDNVMFDFNDGPGKRFLFRDCTSRSADADAVFSLRDNKKALSASDVTIVTNKPFLLTKECKIRSGWNAAYCPFLYGKVLVTYTDRFNSDMHVYRTDGNLPSLHLGLDLEKHFLPILGGSHSYLVRIAGSLPSTVNFDARAISKKNNVLIAFCVPRNAEIRFEYRMENFNKRPVHSVTSRQEVLDSDTVGTYYYDSANGVIFFKLMHEVEYGVEEIARCPDNVCPRARVLVTSGDLTDSNCVSRFSAVSEYTQPSSGTATNDDAILPATSADPPETFGHGPTYPF